MINPVYRSASITIAGSNNPHGVVQFGPNSLNVRVNEDSGKISIQIDRKFGAIGKTKDARHVVGSSHIFYNIEYMG